MKDNWKKLQAKKIDSSDPVEKKINHLKKVINDPDRYNTNLASKERVESLEKKLTLLHNKIDSIYSLLETLSDRLNALEYSGEITYGEPHHIGRKEKSIKVNLRRKLE